MTALVQPKGFCRLTPSTVAQRRLFCFPFAGGNAHVFKELATQMPKGIEVYGVDFPGRGTRFGEAPLRDLSTLIDDLADGIRFLLDRPFVFYGHSNGALVAFELARRLAKVHYREPDVLILGAKRCPTCGPETPIHHLDDATFKMRLRDYDGTPDNIMECPDLMQVYLPILKADFALSETYELRDRSKLSCPIHAVAGTQDALANPKMMQHWAEFADGSFTLHQIEDGHFFLHTNPEATLGCMASALAADPLNSRI